MLSKKTNKRANKPAHRHSPELAPVSGYGYGLTQSQINLAKQIVEVRAAKGVAWGLDLESTGRLLDTWERGLVEQMKRYEAIAHTHTQQICEKGE